MIGGERGGEGKGGGELDSTRLCFLFVGKEEKKTGHAMFLD